MDVHPTGLTDDDFWSGSEEAIEAFRDTRRGEVSEELVLDGPTTVSLSDRGGLPMHVYWRAPLRRTAASPLQENLRIAVVHLGRAFYVEPQRVFEPTEPFEPGDGVTTEYRAFDLRARLGLPWKRGTLLVTGLLRDQITNRVRIRLDDGVGAHRDEEVERFLAEQARLPTAPDVHPLPGSPFPSFARLEGSPPVPTSAGIALAIERIVVTRRGARAVLHGSFRLPVLDRELVSPTAPWQPAAGVSRERPAAIVPLTLAIVGSGSARAMIRPMRVPVWGPLEGRESTGHFAVDLLTDEDFPAEAQTFFVYAMSGEILTGPTLVATVTPDMLP